MPGPERFARLAAAAARRPAATLGIVLALALAGGVLSLGLRPSAGSDTFVRRSSPAYRATAEDQRHFGQDAVIVLVSGESLPYLVETADLGRLSQLEACLAGQYVVASESMQAFVPVAGHAPYGGPGSPCGQLMRMRAAQVVYGPGTFLNRAVIAVRTEFAQLRAGIEQQERVSEAAAFRLAVGRGESTAAALKAARAAGELEYVEQLQSLEQLALDTGLSGLPSIDTASSQFVPDVVFDQTRGVNEPKARFAYLFPTRDSALIQVRLRASLSDAQTARAVSLIRAAVRMPMFALQHGGTYTVTGVPVVLGDLATTITGSIGLLLLAALIVMACVLLIVFRSSLPLMPLLVALAAAGITFGLLALVGATLTMASIAVLPILIGLAVDYAIQFQARAEEAGAAAAGRRAGRAAAEAPGPTLATAAVAEAAGRTGPTLAAAALATATGFLVLLLSPVPMVQGFGVILVVGIAVALACALTMGSAALAARERDGGALGASWRGAGEILAPPARTVAASLRGAGEILGVGATRSRRWMTAAARRPAAALALAALLAIGGWVAGTRLPVQSDVTKLVPAGMPALRNLRALERVTGVSGEIDVTVSGRDVATPSTVGWMIHYENALLTHYGYTEERGCATSTLCPALSLPDLFDQSSEPDRRISLTQQQIDQLLSAVPTYFSQAVITPDHREAMLAFGIRLMPLARQQRVIDYMRSQLHPPAATTAHLAGLPVLAAQANAALSSTSERMATMLAALLAVALVLLAVLRDWRRTIVPLVPIVLATGWSSLILWLIGIPLNPMSATLGTLVIAISTEFSVLLAERFRQERAAGHEPQAALSRAYSSTGAAVLASGITAIAGFAVLIVSDIAMLRDFGLVTLVDLGVSLTGVLAVLPAVLAVDEARAGRGGVRSPAERALRLRRRATVA